MNFPVGSYGSVYWGAQNSSAGKNFNAQNYTNNAQPTAPVTAYNWNTPYAIYDASYYDRYKSASSYNVNSSANAPATLNNAAPVTPANPNIATADLASIEAAKITAILERASKDEDAGLITHAEHMSIYNGLLGRSLSTAVVTITAPANPDAAIIAENSNLNAQLQNQATQIAQLEQQLQQTQKTNADLASLVKYQAEDADNSQVSSQLTDLTNYASVVPYSVLKPQTPLAKITGPDATQNKGETLTQTQSQFDNLLTQVAQGATDPQKRLQAFAATAQVLAQNAPDQYAQLVENIKPDLENFKKRVDALIAHNNTDKDFRAENHASIEQLKSQYNTLALSFEKMPNQDKAPFAPISTTVLTGRLNHSITSPFGVSSMVFDQNLHNASQIIAFGLKRKTLYKNVSYDVSIAGGLAAGIPYNISGYKLEGSTVKPLKNVDNVYYLTPMLSTAGGLSVNLGKGKVGLDFEYKKQVGRTDEFNGYLRYKPPSTFLNGFVKEVYYHHVRSRYLRQNDQDALTAESTQFGAQLVRHRFHTKIAVGKGTLTVGYRNEFRDTPAPHGMQVIDILRDGKVSDSFLNRQSKRVEVAYQVPVYHSGQMSILAGGRVRFDDNKRMADYDLDNGIVRQDANGALLTKLKSAEQVAFVEPRIDIKFGSNASIYFFGRIAGSRKQGENFNFNEAFSSLAESGTAAQTGFGATFNLGQKKRYDDFKLKF